MKDQRRFIFIDALRGLASISIVLFHIQGAPVLTGFFTAFPQAIQTVLKHGYLGVHLFFIVSGFVIAYSLRNVRINFAYFGNFMLRRLIRLSLPYWVAIALVIFLRYVSNFLLSDRVAPLPSWQQLLAQAFYLQDILRLGNISAIFWTLSIEIQFYIVFCILLATAQKFQVNCNSAKQLKASTIILVFGSVSLLAVAWPLGFVSEDLLPGLFIPYFYIFMLGVFAWWSLEKKLPEYYFIFYLIIIFIGATFTWKIDANFTVLTTIVIYIVGRLGKLQNWLNIAWLQYRGRISYSLYLTHVSVILPILNVSHRINKDFAFGSLLWISVALIVSLVTAHCLWEFIEKPSAELSKRFKPVINQ